MSASPHESRAFDYAGRRFASVSNSAGGDVDSSTIFEYRQNGDLVWATYSGGAVRYGMLIARLLSNGGLDARYQHMTAAGEIKTGICTTMPEQLVDGRLRLHEAWEWTSGDRARGTSIVEEVAP